METKTLLTGIISFIAGALLVSVAATTFEKDKLTQTNETDMTRMSGMTGNLEGKTGDEFDKAFLADMIVHHEGALEMAKLAGNQARHDEVKQLSQEIIAAQETEITQMEKWQSQWGYSSTDTMDHMEAGGH